jgi:hypothetical protein
MTKKINWSENQVGGFWVKATAKGNKFMSGTVKMKLSDLKENFLEDDGETVTIRLAVFKNDYKKDNNPDFNCFTFKKNSSDI